MKNKYTVKFELFGKRMQLNDVEANNKTEAMEYVKSKIIFHHIEGNDNPFVNSWLENVPDTLKDLFNFKGDGK